MGRNRLLRRVALVVALCSVAAGCSSGPAAPTAPDASVGQQLHRRLPDTVLEAPLVDPAGRAVRLSSYRDKIVVLSDMMTLCQESCPLDTVEVVAGARAVQHAGLGRQVQFVSVTVDPARDTPARIAAYQRLFAPVPSNWTALTGPPAVIAAFWKQLGVFVQKVPEGRPAARDWLTGKPLTYDVTHSDALFFVDGTGSERFLLLGTPHVASGTGMPPELERFLNAEGRENLRHPAATAWTLDDELAALSWLTGRRIAPAPPR